MQLRGPVAPSPPARTDLVLVPFTGGPDDVDRVRQAVVDGPVVRTTTRCSPPRASGLPTVVHGGPDTDGLHLVAVDDRSAAGALPATGLRGTGDPPGPDPTWELVTRGSTR